MADTDTFFTFKLMTYWNLNVKMPGIYCFTHISSNKKYIGSSINCKRRLQEHLGDLKADKHYNKHLQHYWNKYSHQEFKIEILEKFSLEEYVTKEFILKREKYWIDFYKSAEKQYGFNFVKDPIIGGKFGMKIPSKQIKKQIKSFKKSEFVTSGRCIEISRKNIKSANTPENRKRALKNRRSYLGKSNPFYGKKHTEETRLQMSKNHANVLGDKNPNFGKTHSLHARSKISSAMNSRTFSTIKRWLIKYKNNTYLIWNFKKFAKNIIGVCPETLYRKIKNGKIIILSQSSIQEHCSKFKTNTLKYIKV